jgi:hypothetical protein
MEPSLLSAKMIWNIIDRRTRSYRWSSVNAIVEATWHDNSVQDADHAPPVTPESEVTYDQRESISVADAIEWASSQPCPVTLYLYDEGAGTA